MSFARFLSHSARRFSPVGGVVLADASLGTSNPVRVGPLFFPIIIELGGRVMRQAWAISTQDLPC